MSHLIVLLIHALVLAFAARAEAGAARSESMAVRAAADPTVVAAGGGGAESVSASSDRRIENLVALARLYNVVRFFHPSDEVAETSWDAFMMHAAIRVTYARDSGELRDTLLEVFEPIAPTLTIAIGGAPPDERPEPAADAVHVHRRHLGVQLGERPNVYRSPRVSTDDPDTPAEIALAPGTSSVVDLGRDLHARVPLTLARDASGATIPAADAGRLARLRADMDSVGVAGASGDDVFARVASICMIWAAMDSFFPYFDQVENDWDAELDDSLRRALMPQNGDTFALVVSRMVEALEDGHGIVGYRYRQWHHQPSARFERLREGEIAVTRTWDDTPLEIGDVVKSVDGRPAEGELDAWKRLTSGSEHLQEHRALNRFASGPPRSAATFVVDRAGEERTVEVPRTEIGNMFFRTAAFDHPMFDELEPGLWYVNLSKIDGAGFEAHVDRLIAAEGIILDYRWGSSGADDFDSRTLVQMLIDEPKASPAWQYPIASGPDPEHRGWWSSGWNYSPIAPHLDADVAVLVAPPVVSYGETLMSFFRAYDLGILVGSATAGCNGNANTLMDLPAKVYVTFTGMKVEKHDGSTLYGIGYEPDVPVVPSLAGIRSGRDEVREAAVEALTG